MSRTVRARAAHLPEVRARWAGHDRDHHCRVLGCWGQRKRYQREGVIPPMKASDQRRSDSADPHGVW